MAPISEDRATNSDIEDVIKLIDKPLVLDEFWYLIDQKWFDSWHNYHKQLGYVDHPGPVDNTGITDGKTGSLRHDLYEGLDYKLVPEKTWNYILKECGLTSSQEPIRRRVIQQGLYSRENKVEVYPLRVTVRCRSGDVTDNGESTSSPPADAFTFSRVQRVGETVSQLRKHFKVDPKRQVRLWLKFVTSYEILEKHEMTLTDVSVMQDSEMVLELASPDGSWPFRPAGGGGSGSSLATSSSGGGGSSALAAFGSNTPSPVFDDYRSSRTRGAGRPGLTGLSNLGNTCFMNSALQCLSNVSALTEYCLTDRWRDELNPDNPLGMNGEIARTYAELISVIWSGRESFTSPRGFKIAVGRFAPQFSGFQQQVGFQQQDSQELMAFLLDGLHEDLNRIRKKPYIEMKDADGRPDALVATESWTNYQRRNDSIIVDLFHALLKSTVVCPVCRKVSVTFDPFCYLSLPLPVRRERLLTVTFVPMDPFALPTTFKVTVSKSGSLSDVARALSALAAVPATQLVIADVYNCRFHKIFSPDDLVSQVMEKDDLFAYHVPIRAANDDADQMWVPLYMRERKTGGSLTLGSSVFGLPLLLVVPRGALSVADLYEAAKARLGRFLRPSADENGVADADAPGSGGGGGGQAGAATPDEDECAADAAAVALSGAVGGPLIDSTHPFVLQSVNAFGTTDQDNLRNPLKHLLGLNPKPKLGVFAARLSRRDMCTTSDKVRLTNRSYLAADWEASKRSRHFDSDQLERVTQHASVHTSLSPKRSVVHLDECLDLFASREQLGVQDSWYCPVCKEHRQASKQLELWTAPRILVIHLKRFSYSKYFRDKIDVLVDFPTRGLDMTERLISPDAKQAAIYDLISVSNHYGGLGGGHYTAFALNSITQKWYSFDDSIVSPASEGDVCTKAAYVLVYQLRAPGSQRPAAAAAADTVNGAVDTGEEPMDQS